MTPPGGSGDGESRVGFGWLESLLFSHRRRRWPGQLGKVGSPPHRASPRSPRPRSLSSPPRALGSRRGAPGTPGPGLATPRPRPARAGLPTPPSAACSRRPRPTRSPAHFPRRRPTSPGGRPRAGRRRRARTDALCSRRCGRRSRRARRGRSGAGGGGGQAEAQCRGLGTGPGFLLQKGSPEVAPRVHGETPTRPRSCSRQAALKRQLPTPTLHSPARNLFPT